MTVHNIAEYVKYHQEKFRQQQQAAQSQSSSSTPSSTSNSTAPPKSRAGVNQIHSKASFQSSVIEASADKIVVVDYFATWCGPCKAISPTIAKWSQDPQFEGVSFVKVDVDEVSDVAQEQGIRAMPTFAIFKNGEKIEEVVGANPQALFSKIQGSL